MQIYYKKCYSDQILELFNFSVEYIERDMIWENRNEGAFSWMEQNGHQQKIAANMTMRFRRGDTAELFGMFDLATPFPHWEKNFLEVK